MENEHVVQMKGISKGFGAVQALKNVDLELRRGEILGLVGDNGAGKSTLVKVLYGAMAPDEGEILVEGQVAQMRSPRDAQALGIGMIYQDLALFNNLDVAANVFTGRETTRRWLGLSFLDQRPMYEQTTQLVNRLKVKIASPRMLVEKMSGGQRQMVAVARAIGCECKILIMDEPTAALGVKEATTLLEIISGLKEQGISIILITHRLPDVLTVGDRIMVLKGGERVGMLQVGRCSLDDVVTCIVRGRADGTLN